MALGEMSRYLLVEKEFNSFEPVLNPFNIDVPWTELNGTRHTVSTGPLNYAG